MTDTIENQSVTFKSPLTQKEFDPAVVLLRIQKKLRDTDYRDRCSDTLTDEIDNQVAAFDMIINGLSYLYGNTDLKDALTENEYHGLCLSWYELKVLLDDREAEYSVIWDLAIHGEIDNHKSHNKE